jgi:hypothetical protein
MKAFVRVGQGVRIEVVDWGGADKPATMVLLAGLGDNTHVYDQFAFHSADYFHLSELPAEDTFHPASRKKAMTLTPEPATTSRS